MSLAKKIGVSIVFAIGLVGIIAAVVRTYYIVNESTEYETDFTYAFSSVMVSCLAEGACIILIMCAPCTPKAVAALPSTFSNMRSWVDSSVEWLRGTRRSDISTSSSERPHMGAFGLSKGGNSYSNIDEAPH
ncbi:hypothetical protein GGR53DRAFT_526974 [Hypoxylon sp. FL1150]|nr:hypothetical protein GGR53DRAFT_526974 [Hypoxylon sp. FL1150]